MLSSIANLSAAWSFPSLIILSISQPPQEPVWRRKTFTVFTKLTKTDVKCIMWLELIFVRCVLGKCNTFWVLLQDKQADALRCQVRLTACLIRRFLPKLCHEWVTLCVSYAPTSSLFEYLLIVQRKFFLMDLCHRIYMAVKPNMKCSFYPCWTNHVTMNYDFSYCLLDGVQKCVRINVFPKHRYH